MERGISIVSLSMIIAVMVTVSACTNAPVASSPDLAMAEAVPAPAEPKARVVGEYLVTLVDNKDEAAISEHYARFGIKEISALGDETFLLVLSNDPGPQVVEAAVRDDPRIKAVQPNLVYWPNRSGKRVNIRPAETGKEGCTGPKLSESGGHTGNCS